MLLLSEHIQRLILYFIHTDRENLHDEIDHHKNDGLQKQKDGKGHWKGELASQSEAAVCAPNPLLYTQSCHTDEYNGSVW